MAQDSKKEATTLVDGLNISWRKEYSRNEFIRVAERFILAGVRQSTISFGLLRLYHAVSDEHNEG